MTSLIYQDVFWFNVTMDYAVLMQLFYCNKDLSKINLSVFLLDSAP